MFAPGITIARAKAGVAGHAARGRAFGTYMGGRETRVIVSVGGLLFLSYSRGRCVPEMRT